MLITSWSGNRPLEPQASTGHIYAFQNHGVMYVTFNDLIVSYGALAASLLLLGAAFIASRLEKRKRTAA